MEYIYGYQKTRAGLSRWLEDVGKRQPDDQLARSSSSDSPGFTTITARQDIPQGCERFTKRTFLSQAPLFPCLRHRPKSLVDGILIHGA